jgi:hypothetical protein
MGKAKYLDIPKSYKNLSINFIREILLQNYIVIELI